MPTRTDHVLASLWVEPQLRTPRTESLLGGTQSFSPTPQKWPWAPISRGPRSGERGGKPSSVLPPRPCPLTGARGREAWAAISLAPPLPTGSSGLPAPEFDRTDRPGQPSSTSRTPGQGLFDLARGGVCRAPAVASRAVRSYRTVSPLPDPDCSGHRRSVLCGTFPRPAVGRVGVTHHRVLSCSDFPQTRLREPAAASRAKRF